MRIVLDTNVLIYFLEGTEPHVNEVENLLNSFMRGENQGIISTINIAEILTGFYIVKDEKRASKAKSLFQDLTYNSFEIVPVTFQIADLAASLRAKRGGRLPDAIVAATAIDRAANCIYSQDEDLQRFGEDIKILKL